MEIGSEFSARCALNVLHLCLDAPFDPSRAVLKLSKSHAFSVLISSARLWFYDEILQIRPRFDEVFPQTGLPPSIPFPDTLLRRAVLLDDLTQEILFTRHEILSAIASNLPMWSFVSKTFSIAHRTTFYHLYLHVASDFIEVPTLLGAYLVTDLLVRTVNALGEDQLPLEGSAREQWPILFNSLRACLQQSTPIGSREGCNCDFLFPANLDELEAFVSGEVGGIDIGNFVEPVFKCPSFASGLPDYILKEVSDGSDQMAAKIADQILVRWSDFSALFIKCDIFFDVVAVFVGCRMSEKLE